MARKATQSTNEGPVLKLKISAKGALSVYGLGRFPVTLYKEQWLAVIDKADGIRSFIKANDKELKSKAESGGPAGSVAI